MHTQGSNNFWWKVVEASLLSLGVVKDLLESQQKENQLPLDIVVILQSSLDQHNRMAGKRKRGFFQSFIINILYTGSVTFSVGSLPVGS